MRSKTCGIVFFILATWEGWLAAPSWAQVSFLEISAPSGLGPFEMASEGFGSGLAAADYDDDGDLDFFVPTASGVPDQLYRNLGNGLFEDIATEVGLDDLRRGRVALWLDYDADHRLDLLVAGDCYLQTESCLADVQLLRLHRQLEDGSFIEVAVAAGVADTSTEISEHRGGLAAGDVNGDGLLDIVTSFWMGTFQLFINQGDGTFIEAAEASGIGKEKLGYHQPVILDFNRDGLLDLYLAVDFDANRLLLNQGPGPDGIPTFVDQAEAAGCDNSMNDMGVTVGDLEGDGDPDLYISNIFQLGQHNVLLRNDSTKGTVHCAEISGSAGVQDGGWGWGVSFLDVNNDSSLDLVETGGWNGGRWEEPMRLFIRQLDDPPTFVDRALQAGLQNRFWGSSLLALDIDRDGDLDLLRTVVPVLSPDGAPTSRIELYANQLAAGTSGHHYLVIRPRMQGPNHRAIGARIELRAGGKTMNRWILAGSSYLGQEPAEAFFGLGTSTVVEEVTVHWPGGGRTTLRDLAADQTRTVYAIFSNGFESGDLSQWAPTVR